MSFWDIASSAATLAAGIYGGPMVGALAGAGIAGLRGQDPLMGGVSGYLSGMGGSNIASAADSTAAMAKAAGTGSGTINSALMSNAGALGPSASMTGFNSGIGSLTPPPGFAPPSPNLMGPPAPAQFGSVQGMKPGVDFANMSGTQPIADFPGGGGFNKAPVDTLAGTNNSSQYYPREFASDFSEDVVYNPANNTGLKNTEIGPDFSKATPVPPAERYNFVDRNTVIPEGGFSMSDRFNAVTDNPGEFFSQMGDGNKLLGAGKFGLSTLPLAASVVDTLYPYEETSFSDTFEDDRFRGPQGQLNLSGDTGLRLKGGGVAKPKGTMPSGPGKGFGSIGLRRLLTQKAGTSNNRSGMQTTGVPDGMSIADVMLAARGYDSSGKKVKMAEGGITGVSSSPGLPIAGASSGITGGPGMEAVDSISGGSISTPAGTETFESMVASGVHPANAAAMFGMDTSPYLDTGPGMTFYGSGSTPTSSGIGTLPPPPVPFTPTTDFDYEEYTGGYMEPLGGKTPVGLDTGSYGAESIMGYPSPVGPGITKSRFEEMIRKGYANGGFLQGPGDGMSDSLPAMIGNNQPAALSEGEFVVPADVVSHLGNGSSNAGSKRLYAMMDHVRKDRTGTEKQGKEINPERYMPA